MNSLQRTIKYVAIGFAVFLAVVIVAGIANLAFAVISAVSGGVNYYNDKTVDYTDSFFEVRSLDIDNSTGKLIIKTGNEFKVEGKDVSEGFSAKVSSDGTLEISDDESRFEFLWFDFNGFNNPNSKITVYLPEDFIARDTLIDTGAGTVNMEGLHTEYLMISAGAGSISGSNITAEEVEIDGGIGSVTFTDINFEDADFNCGVGNLKIDGILLGETTLDCGVGNVDLNLAGDVDDYDLEVDSGVGTIRLNGKKVSDEYETDKNAPNFIEISGGVGDVSIDID